MSTDPVVRALQSVRQAGGTPVEGGRGVASSREKKTSTTRHMATRMDGRPDRSYRDPKGFHDLVQREYYRQGWERQFAVHKLMNAWPELVGEVVAMHTTPVKFEEENQRLVIQCDSTTWATQLRYIQRDILKSFARRLGPDVVAELEIRNPNTKPRSFGRLRVQGMRRER